MLALYAALRTRIVRRATVTRLVESRPVPTAPRPDSTSRLRLEAMGVESQVSPRDPLEQLFHAHDSQYRSQWRAANQGRAAALRSEANAIDHASRGDEEMRSEIQEVREVMHDRLVLQARGDPTHDVIAVVLAAGAVALAFL